MAFALTRDLQTCCVASASHHELASEISLRLNTPTAQIVFAYLSKPHHITPSRSRSRRDEVTAVMKAVVA